ncbi:MAG: N-acetylmuramidase, partial [Streptococcus salivarius]
MYRHLKKYMIFIVGAFVCSLFLVLAFTTDRKNDNSVNA